MLIITGTLPSTPTTQSSEASSHTSSISAPWMCGAAHSLSRSNGLLNSRLPIDWYSPTFRAQITCASNLSAIGHPMFHVKQ